MATSMKDWRKILNRHPILAPIRKFRERLNTIHECKNWVAVKDGELFIWNPHSPSIITSSLKHELLKSADNTRPTQSQSQPQIQTFGLTKLPIHEVDSLLFSPSGNCLALVSKHELIVVHIPQRWGKHSGKDKILCKSVAIGERLLMGQGMKLVSVAWHPASLDDSHITILTSDNFVRTFDIQSPSNPVESVCVLNPDMDSFQGSSLNIGRMLGDCAVSFDFGAAVEITQKCHMVPRNTAVADIVWPTYVLLGNGDVYQVFSYIGNKRTTKPTVQGPLSMYPVAEDNYGCDACAIMCLPGELSVLVIATMEGKLHHSIVLPVGKDNGTHTGEWPENSLLDETKVPSYAMYVYETLQLGMSLTSVPDHVAVSLDDPYTTLIKLQKDISQPDRYMCSHNAGLHAIYLPWFSHVQDFSKTDDEDETLPNFPPESQAMVEHLVCTKPMATSPDAPPLGTAIISEKLLGTTLLLLTCTLEFVCLPLRGRLQSSCPAPLLSDQSTREIASPLKQLHKEHFDSHIQMILRRDTTLPVMKATKGTELSPPECFQVLNQAVQVMRESYIQKQDQARDEIERRVQLLQEQKVIQEEELQSCRQSKVEMTSQAEALAEKYEEAKDQQEIIVYRLKDILRNLYDRMPVMSDAEKDMHKELKTIEDKINLFRSFLQQLRIKRDYQSKQMSHNQQQGQRMKESTKHFPKTQQQHLKTLLQKEGDEIADLVHRMSDLKTTLDN